MNKFEDIDLVNFIINNGASLKEAAIYFDVSIDTVKKRMKKIRTGLNDDSSIIDELNSVKNKNLKDGRQKGGESLNSGPLRNTDLESIAYRAKVMLANNLTIDSAAISFSVAPSTLYEHLELLNCKQYKELYNDLKSLYEYHKKFNEDLPIPTIEERTTNKNNTWLKGVQERKNFVLSEMMMKYSNILNDENKNGKKY